MRSLLTPHRIAIALLVVAALIVGGTLALRDHDAQPAPAPATLSPGAGLPASDPLAWTASRTDDYVARATQGYAHVLYAKTADGLATGVRRTASWRADIEAACKGTDIEPDTLEAIVLLESAGRPEAQASDDLAGAVGLTQIVAETGQDLLHLHVDLAASRKVTKQIVKAAGKGDLKRLGRLRAQRRRVDERFDPQKSLAATIRYLDFAKGELHGRDDLAIAGYHMGVGNLQTALARYGSSDVPYAQLFFDSTPTHHAAAWRFLTGLGDDSSTYLWRIDAARQIMALSREDPAELKRRTALMTMRNSSEVLLHPPEETTHFASPDDVRKGYDDGTLVHLPRAYLAAHGLAIDPQMGELASEVGEKPALYRGLRREALAMLAYIGTGVRSISGAKTPLEITSTVRDAKYQAKLGDVEIQATHSYSLHTTGFTFDIARTYASRRQAMALQFLLDRLTALNLIAWVREPGAIHVTVASDAARLMEPMGVLPKDAAHTGATG
jgi:soluble lytic murein transglycosylase-like protein